MNPTPRSTGRGNRSTRLGRALSPVTMLIIVLIIVGVLGVACGAEDSSSNSEVNGESTSSTEQEAGLMMEGTIKIEDLDDPITISAVTVRLQDVGRAGAAAQNAAEVTIENASFSPGDATRFSLTIPNGIDPTGSYILSAHADMDGSGDISVGDYITMASNPVVVDGSQGLVELLLRLVTS